MNENAFWEIIDKAHEASKGDMDEKCAQLKSALHGLSDDDLRAFSEQYDRMDHKAYTWPLWAAAYILNGGCSDDSFMDFRDTLISMGSRVFSEAVEDPSSLSSVSFWEDDPCIEGYRYAINDVLEERLGELPPRRVPLPENPSGEEWDEDTVESLYPQLKCLDDDSTGQPEQEDKAGEKPWWKFW